MANKYDSEQIRQLARQVGKIAEDTQRINRTELGAVSDEIPVNFKGAAANALQDVVGELMGDVRSVTSELQAIQQSLNALARKVEIADQQAKAAIEGK